MKKVPFRYGLFYHAMIGLMGRNPDTAVAAGFEGFYEFWYLPWTEDDYKLFHTYAATLAKWLDNFEILVSRSQCEFVNMTVGSGPARMILVVKINLEQQEKTAS